MFTFFPCVNFFELLTSPPFAWFSLYQLLVLTLNSDRTINYFQYDEANNIKRGCVCVFLCSWSPKPCFSLDFFCLFSVLDPCFLISVFSFYLFYFFNFNYNSGFLTKHAWSLYFLLPPP